MLVVMQSCDSHFEYLMSRSLNLSCLQVTPSNVDCVLSENVEDIDFVFFFYKFSEFILQKNKNSQLAPSEILLYDIASCTCLAFNCKSLHYSFLLAFQLCITVKTINPTPPLTNQNLTNSIINLDKFICLSWITCKDTNQSCYSELFHCVDLSI